MSTSGRPGPEIRIVDIFRGKIIDLSKHSLVIELTGTPSKINGFMEVMEEYNITDVCRTGITGIEGLKRGEDDSAQK